jgi:hypothetical protein
MRSGLFAAHARFHESARGALRNVAPDWLITEYRNKTGKFADVMFAPASLFEFIREMITLLLPTRSDT